MATIKDGGNQKLGFDGNTNFCRCTNAVNLKFSVFEPYRYIYAMKQNQVHNFSKMADIHNGRFV